MNTVYYRCPVCDKLEEVKTRPEVPWAIPRCSDGHGLMRWDGILWEGESENV